MNFKKSCHNFLEVSNFSFMYPFLSFISNELFRGCYTLTMKDILRKEVQINKIKKGHHKSLT